MMHPLSPHGRRILEELNILRGEARSLLDVASANARAEWEKLETRFPSDLEIRGGLIAFSCPELDEMRAKVRRFRDILSGSSPHWPSDPDSDPDCPGRDNPS
jgi:hypothetical protein